MQGGALIKFFILIGFLSLSACSSTGPNAAGSATLKTDYNIERAELVESRPLSRIAFGSCQHQKNEQKIFKTVLESKPELYITMGDNVYASKPEDQPLSEAYLLQSQNEDFRNLWKQTPVIATWDDHDYGLNDGGKENSLKEEARSEFMAFFPEDAKKISKNQPGIYHSFLFGTDNQRVLVILLDTRWNRDELELQTNPKSPLDKYRPTEDQGKTILGSVQWRWLEEQLLRPADLKIVVTSIQLLPAEHGFEKWANFPAERERFLNLIKKVGPKNLLILSGDRHLSEISELALPGYGTVTEITASSINRLSNLTEEKNSLRKGAFFTKESFGLLNIDWVKRQVMVEIKDLTGKPVLSAELKLQK